jgi:hypothetical protein
MWTIAEGTDPAAIEEFGDRYPGLREELLKRIRTIKALKSGNRIVKTSNVPTFQNPKVQPANRTLVWASLAFALIAVFSFGIYKASVRSIPQHEIKSVNVEAPKLPQANISTEQIGINPMMVPQPNNNRNNNPAPQSQVPETNHQMGSNSQVPNTVKTLRLESAPLQSVILMIAESGHYNASIAPGMPNPTVKIDFVNMEPMEMLKELGDQYAFTTVMDGPRTILIIPKKDEDEGQISGNH